MLRSLPKRVYVGTMTNDHTDTATRMLRDEHKLILKVAHALDARLEAERNGIALDYDVAASCVSFFRLFADACHHGKEEDLLFPELEQQGLPHDSGPIAVMLDEHERGRAFVRTMAASLEAARGGDAEAVVRLRGAAEGYIALIVAHIDKEDSALFTMADGMIVGPTCADLCAGYDEVCARSFEGRTKDDLEELAAEILEHP